MPNLQSLPRELRDEIYGWIIRSPMGMKQSHHGRKRIPTNTELPAADLSANDSKRESHSLPTYQSDGPSSSADDISGAGYHVDEEQVRYPTSKPLPPTQSFLRICRGFRDELLDSINKKRLTYKLRLVFRNDTDTIYPTWISVPAIKNHIDTLEVEVRIRHGRSKSLFSMLSQNEPADDELEHEGDAIFGSLVLLQRFLERGVDFLSKKRAQGLTMSLLSLTLIPNDVNFRTPAELFKEVCDVVDFILLGKDPENVSDEKYDGQRMHEFVRLFASKIGMFEVKVVEFTMVWVMAESFKIREAEYQRRHTSKLEGDIQSLQ